MGRPAHDAARLLIELTGVPLTVEQVLSQSAEGLEKAFREVQPLPGVIKLVKHLEKHKVPMAVSFFPFRHPKLRISLILSL